MGASWASRGREIVDTAELLRLADAIRAGCPVADGEFDRVYPERVRRLSARFWTPVAVAVRAAALLVDGGASRVLDVGAGVGKFCIVGALVTGASFTGVEERADRVAAARRAVAAFRVSSVTLVHGRMERVAFDSYDGFYFFNPFAEVLEPGLAGARGREAATRYWRDVSRAQAALVTARPGARLVTYHGFGGLVPPGYRLVAREASATGPLECWEKVDARARAAEARRARRASRGLPAQGAPEGLSIDRAPQVLVALPPAQEVRLAIARPHGLLDGVRDHQRARAEALEGRIEALEIEHGDPVRAEAIERGDDPPVQGDRVEAQRADLEERGGDVAMERAHGLLGEHAGLSLPAPATAVERDERLEDLGAIRGADAGGDEREVPALVGPRPGSAYVAERLARHHRGEARKVRR